MSSPHVAFLGTGKLNQALIRGFQKASVPLTLKASVRSEDSAMRLRENFPNLSVTRDNRELLQGARYVILGVKPQHALELLRELRGDFMPGATLISLCARLPLRLIRESVGSSTVKLVRLMPNTACETGQGLLGYSPEDLEIETELKELLSSLGTLQKIDENDMDTFTVLGACAPAFILKAAQALAQAAENEGLPTRFVQEALAQVLLGTGALLESPLSPQERIAQIATPGGVTAQGLEVLENRALSEAYFEAFRRSLEKCRSLTLG